MLLTKVLTHCTAHKIKWVLPRAPHGQQNRLLSLTSRLANKDSPTIADNKTQKYLESLRVEFYNLRANPTAQSQSRLNRLDGVVSALEQYRLLKTKIASKEDICNEKDEEMRMLLLEENKVYGDLLLQTEEELFNQMLVLTEDQQFDSIIFEVNAGAGGQEAMLFARELFDMYTNYFDYNGWAYEIIDNEGTDIGGLRHGNVIVQNRAAFNQLQYEAGVHRVQRVPATEKSGRLHTSTASVTVIPRPDDVDVRISEKDLKIETKRASGAGGQHVNTTDSAVRVVHLPTGLAVECQTERSQLKNRERAIHRLQAKLVQRELESKELNEKRTRKAQQGNLNRNEKIRTYNFVQDRITDHRIANGTVHNLEEFFEGTEDLERLIQRIAIEFRRAKLTELINNFETLVRETGNHIGDKVN
ncbi:peptide chain release factor 1 isoform X1 [Rhagoletis pomonella]|uniref:peptide chain release factor 1 isoform X1 n=1 Tax=Rhagoletis pomonella TaxID=28610 RepID=UPI00178475D2|nr:peptide chain release factor 1 isoform X1 [Rhagoletis pomonella]